MMVHLTSTRHTIKSVYAFMNDLGIDIRHDAEALLNASIRGDIDLTPNMAPEKFLDREMFLRKPYQALHDAMKAAHDSWDEVMVCFNVSLPPDIDLEKELQCWESLLHVMEIIKGQESRFKKLVSGELSTEADVRQRLSSLEKQKPEEKLDHKYI